jgi:hypothetical protein
MHREPVPENLVGKESSGPGILVGQQEARGTAPRPRQRPAAGQRIHRTSSLWAGEGKGEEARHLTTVAPPPPRRMDPAELARKALASPEERSRKIGSSPREPHHCLAVGKQFSRQDSWRAGTARGIT